MRGNMKARRRIGMARQAGTCLHDGRPLKRGLDFGKWRQVTMMGGC